MEEVGKESLCLSGGTFNLEGTMLKLAWLPNVYKFNASKKNAIILKYFYLGC